MGADGTGDAIRAIGGARAMGATIRALRGRAGISRKTLAARIAMHHNYLGTIERGAVPNPGLETINRIAGGLGVSIAVLAESFAMPAEASPSASETDEPSSPVPHNAHDARALGAAIRMLRRRVELTQVELADTTAVHRSHLISIEAGEKPNPGIGTIAKIARGLQPDDREPPLLARLAQIFTGELAPAHLRASVGSQPSGPPAARQSPPTGAGT